MLLVYPVGMPLVLFLRLRQHRARLNPPDVAEEEVIMQRKEDAVLAADPLTKFSMLVREAHARRHLPPSLPPNPKPKHSSSPTPPLSLRPPTAPDPPSLPPHTPPPQYRPQYWWYHVYNTVRKLALTCLVLIFPTLESATLLSVFLVLVTLAIGEHLAGPHVSPFLNACKFGSHQDRRSKRGEGVMPLTAITSLLQRAWSIRTPPSHRVPPLTRHLPTLTVNLICCWQVVLFVLYLLLVDSGMARGGQEIVISGLLCVANIVLVVTIFGSLPHIATAREMLQSAWQQTQEDGRSSPPVSLEDADDSGSRGVELQPNPLHREGEGGKAGTGHAGRPDVASSDGPV